MNERKLAGRETYALQQKMVGEARELAESTAQDLNNFEAVSQEEWEATTQKLNKTVEALDSLENLGMLNDEQKKTRQKLETQKEHIETTLLPYLEKRALKKAA